MEIKSTSPYGFDSIQEPEDLLKNHWYVKWYAQMQIYMLMESDDKCLFILKNKSTGELRLRIVKLDYDYAEELLKKVERVNKHLKEKPHTEKINEPRLCNDCSMKDICMPEISEESLMPMDSQELIEMLEKRMAIIEDGKEYAKIDRKIKEIVKKLKSNKILIGNFHIIKTTSPLVAYDYPDNIKKKYEIESTRTSIEIIPIDNNQEKK